MIPPIHRHIPVNLKMADKSVRPVASKSGMESTTPETSSTSGCSSNTGLSDFQKLFAPKPTATSNMPQQPAPPSIPTAKSVFGPNPWIANPGDVAPNGVSYGYNPEYFATRSTADKLAQMLGGKVVEMNAITRYGPFHQNQLNEMIEMPNGKVVNEVFWRHTTIAA
jgi:hypothetical protein